MSNTTEINWTGNIMQSHSLQLSSSEKSPQSSYPSQIQLAGIQRPVSGHWNSHARATINERIMLHVIL